MVVLFSFFFCFVFLFLLCFLTPLAFFSRHAQRSSRVLHVSSETRLPSAPGSDAGTDVTTTHAILAVAIDTAHPQLAECENPMELAATTLVFRRLVTPVILPYDATHKYAWGTGIVALFRSRCGNHSMRLLLLLLFHTYPHYYVFFFFFYSRSKPLFSF
jgi:hypothetical protein